MNENNKQKNEASNRDEAGKFVKGRSGNPSGRPKIPPEVQELARNYTEEAVQRLVEIMRSDDARIAKTACDSLLDRAWGKPTRALQHEGKDGDELVIKIVRQDANGSGTTL